MFTSARTIKPQLSSSPDHQHHHRLANAPQQSYSCVRGRNFDARDEFFHLFRRGPRSEAHLSRKSRWEHVVIDLSKSWSAGSAVLLHNMGLFLFFYCRTDRDWRWVVADAESILVGCVPWYGTPRSSSILSLIFLLLVGRGYYSCLHSHNLMWLVTTPQLVHASQFQVATRCLLTHGSLILI